jgi:hypothetical protein
MTYHLFSTIEKHGWTDAIWYEFCYFIKSEVLKTVMFYWGGKMVAYKVFYKNYEFKKCDLLGVLTERRNDLRGMTLVESGLRWARLIFGGTVNDRQAIFVVPNELDLSKPRKEFKRKSIFNQRRPKTESETRLPSL